MEESFFPDYDFDEEINDESEAVEEETENLHKEVMKIDFITREIELEDGRPVLISEEEALIQWIEKVLTTVKGRHEIEYEYGTDVKRIMFSGNPKPYIRAEICREIEECLMQHEAITEVDEFEFIDGINASVSFTITSIYGPMTKEVALHG